MDVEHGHVPPLRVAATYPHWCVGKQNPDAEAARAQGTQGVRRYPTDQTVWIQRGFVRSFSIRPRSRRTCSVTVAVPIPSSIDHTCVMIWARENTRRGDEARKTSR